ncbi:hypothetical protein HELRODRAFT_188580, partial [Helobdella robusta]|uniref:Ricin B lectin domain-containing protein n=1 Tax=Helobdella robusta TaxID=6412 RepID=T1FQ53_HELRO
MTHNFHVISSNRMCSELSNDQISNIEERLGKYFLISCKSQPDLVLELKNGSAKSDMQVVVGLLKDESEALDKQLWFWDHPSLTIRSKLSHHCISINAKDELIVQPFSNSENQQWDMKHDNIISEKEFENVFTLFDSNLRPGAPCHVAPYEALIGQLWKFTYLPAAYFFIRHAMTNKVLDIRGESASVGAQIIVYAQKESFDDNQLWYEDQYGILHSKMHDFIINALDNNIVMYPYNKNTRRQKWLINGSYIQNQHRP